MSTLAAAAPPARGAAFGLGWSAAAQLAGTAVRLGSTLALTRLLAPDAYAVLGTALAVLTTLEWVSDTGITPALIRDPRGAEPGWLLTGWWINLARGTALALAAAAAALPLSDFYGRPELAGVLAAVACRPVLVALRSPGVPLLRRRLEYRALFADEVTQTVLGAATSVLVAALVPGAGAWALVAGTLAGAGAGVAASYWLAPVAPRWHRDHEAARSLAGFGGPVLVNTMAMAAWMNLDRLLGLKLLAPEAAGCYVVAWNLAAAAEAVVTRGTDVYFGLLARRPVADRPGWHEAAADRIATVGGPLVAAAAAVAPLAVAVLYDPRYREAGDILAVLLGRLVVRAAGQLDFQLLLASGRVRAGTLAYAAAAVVQAPLLVALAGRYGAVGAAAAGLLSTGVVTVVQAVAAGELGGGALRRAAAAGLWATAGLAAAAAVAASLGR